MADSIDAIGGIDGKKKDVEKLGGAGAYQPPAAPPPPPPPPEQGGSPMDGIQDKLDIKSFGDDQKQ
jgi:hypothetical protein